MVRTEPASWHLLNLSRERHDALPSLPVIAGHHKARFLLPTPVDEGDSAEARHLVGRCFRYRVTAAGIRGYSIGSGQIFRPWRLANQQQRRFPCADTGGAPIPLPWTWGSLGGTLRWLRNRLKPTNLTVPLLFQNPLP
jgi:hypothetical protein